MWHKATFFLRFSFDIAKNSTKFAMLNRGSGSVGRALASQAEGRGFESRLSLQACHEHKLASPHNIFPTAFQGNPKKSVTFAVGFADMAQLVEQRIRNAWVGGSSPPIGSRQEKRGTFGSPEKNVCIVYCNKYPLSTL